MTERTRLRGLIVIKVVLITAGLALTNHSVIERVLFFVRWKEFFSLGVFAGIWLSTLLALIYLAFTPPRITRSVWTAVVVLSSFGGDLFFRLTGDRLSLGAVEAMEIGLHFSVAELTRTALFYQRYIVSALFGSLLLYAGLRLSVPTAKLAAARIRHLSPQAILDRLQDRLALLTGGARDLPLRQRTLKATIEWSYGLLDEDEKRLFRRLAVFRGGRTLDAVEAVCDFDGRLGIDVLNGIASLVDASTATDVPANAK